jgi:UDP:flavonoid glycosyltransferase YjiC (YdhE family)
MLIFQSSSDNSPEGRERNKAMVKSVYEGFLAPANKMFGEQVEKLGGSMPKAHIMDITYTAPDRFLQMCTPSVEYPRSDAPSSLRFAGGLPKGKRDAFINKPSWWNKVENPGAKKVVAVCQGSLALNYAELTIPSIEALKDRQDITLVVALGKKGASLPNDISIPSNTLIADFIPFDDLLPLCSVFISNGGYGGFQHAISNATPLIIAGATEDKPEVAARAEWAGIGVNLKTGTPTPKAIREAVDQVLGDVKYKKRAEELQEEMKEFDPIGEVARNIDELGKLQ